MFIVMLSCSDGMITNGSDAVSVTLKDSNTSSSTFLSSSMAIGIHCMLSPALKVISSLTTLVKSAIAALNKMTVIHAFVHMHIIDP